ncbi:glutathione-independent formaldehyde dehydrogenase [Tilletiopsis washingtonensis]|uniref:Glutathione-independent formaldehyde dehydrogenase n=1 Tax=Tilletiopsis washingtonensis TaxID=58919 RepID=A0A316Z9G4_9BASI|nr:glutathione-independent formaldehyde dehydrogenase [Tilletiopsis washingtonensis]PWN98427.1 glutathione-independent formaldehyde dehydrogenase [Tilletiopsis washingtonensis]
MVTHRAVVYKGPHNVQIEDVPKPTIQHASDVIVKITTSCICGSDLHMYEGRTAAEPGLCFGHENQGIVDEVGSGVTLLKKGDRVNLPFNIGCGGCRNCQSGKTAFCTEANKGFAGAAYGYVAMGPYPGGQAEYLRVPYADFNALILPPGTEHEADYAMLSDIFPTGWHGCKLAGLVPGDTVAVFGAGPVGLMAAYSAKIMGASKIFVVDRVPERLKLAESIGCIPIDFTKSDPVDQIIEQGGMVDRSVDCVGYQAVTSDGKTEAANTVLTSCIKVTRACGGIGCPGLYVPSDPGAPDSESALGMLSLPFGKLFEKGLSIATGQCNVKSYNRQLRDLITSGVAKPSFVVSNELNGLEGAPDAYKKFDQRIEGYSKVLLHPHAK